MLRFLLVLCWPAVCFAQPVEIAHRWGSTRIDTPPERVVSLSFTGADTWLALGVVPHAFRVWYGGDDTGLWPWSAPLLGDARPLQLRGEIDLEAIARLQPDLIDAMYSGISQSQYDALSRIAPVLAPPPGAGDFGATWQQMATAFGQATAREARAQALIESYARRMEDLRNSHPDWQGRTAAIVWPDGLLIYGAQDSRMKALRQLGFRLPDSAKALSRGGFYFRLDREITAPLDADVLIWLDLGSGMSAAREHPLRASLRAPAQGREIVADPTLSAALSYASALSLEYALDQLEPELNLALDGDPATVIPSARAAGLAP